MSFPKLAEAEGKIQAKRREIAKVLDEAGSDYDVKNVKSESFKDGTEFRDWLKARNKELDDLHVEVKDLEVIRNAADEAALADEPGRAEVDGPAPAARQAKSIGRLFVESQAFKGYGGGGVGPVAHLEHADIRNTLFERGDGWEPESTRTGIVTLTPQRRAPHVIDFFNVIPTGQTSVKYMEETVFTNNAVEKAEGAAYGEAALKLVEKSVTVEKVPIWLPITDEQLEDEPGAQAYVESRLRLMLNQRIDRQAVQGDGTTPNLLGTENVTGIQSQAKGEDPIPDAILKLFTKIRDDNDAGGGDAEPNVVFIRASKWEGVKLLRTADGIYIWGHPSQAGPETIWGVPVAQTNAVTATKAVAGDYQGHAFVAPRRGIDVQITNAHSDFFTSGKQAIRLDVRLAVVHLRPAAFGEVTGL